MTLDLNGRRFHPIQNSEAGRVKGDAVFSFRQQGSGFVADYSGSGFTDGHLIGSITGPLTADLVYHSRASDGALEVGEAIAQFTVPDQGPIMIEMQWHWLNGSKAKGTSLYQEILDERSDA